MPGTSETDTDLVGVNDEDNAGMFGDSEETNEDKFEGRGLGGGGRREER